MPHLCAETKDKLVEKSCQLSAMLSVASGCGYESFSGYADDIQENYIWACATLAGDIKLLAENL